MTRAVATPPGLPTAYVELTPAEKAARTAEENKAKADLVLDTLKAEFAGLSKEINDHLEAVIDALPADIKAGIPQATIDKYNEKKQKRTEIENA